MNVVCGTERKAHNFMTWKKKSNIFFLHRMHTQHAAVAPHKYDTDIKSRWKENTTNNKLLAVFTFLLSRFQLTIYAWRRERESRNQTIPALIMIMISQWVGTEFQSSCNFLLIIKFYSLALLYLAERNVANWSLVLESCARVILSTFHQFSLIFNFLLLLPRFGETENCLLMVLICLFSLCTKLAIRTGRLFVFLRRGQKWSRKREKKSKAAKSKVVN